jgi:hypothetical protein
MSPTDCNYLRSTLEPSLFFFPPRLDQHGDKGTDQSSAFFFFFFLPPTAFPGSFTPSLTHSLSLREGGVLDCLTLHPLKTKRGWGVGGKKKAEKGGVAFR